MPSSTVIIAAMPEELSPLRRHLQGAHQQKLGRFTIWTGALVNREVVLLLSGMGERNAREATATALAQLQPNRIYSIGFGGAVRPGLATGDLVLGQGIYSFDGVTATAVSAPPPAPINPHFLQTGRLSGSILTTSHIIAKTVADHHLPADLPHPVLDMETATIAGVAREAGVPLLALRAISDPANEELAFSMDEFCDRDYNLQIWRVLLTLARKPWILPQLLRLSRNCRIAGEALAQGVCDLLAQR